MHDIVGTILHQMMPLTTFFVYTWLGNSLSLSQMAISSMMLGRI